MVAMRFLKICVMVILFVNSVICQTVISGDISKFKFESSNNPFIVDGEIEIPVEKKVVVSEGCIFLFKMYTGFTIKGTLSVEGTTAHPVVFTSINDTSFNTQFIQNPDAFDWNGITVDQRAESVVLKNIRLSYSVYGIKSQKSNVVIQNGLFNSNGQFNFTIFEKIMDIKDNQPYTYPVDKGIAQVENSNNRQISLRITSYPSSAEVYINKKPGKRVSPSAKTPAQFPRLKTPVVEVTLFKKGYTDTTITMNLLNGKVNQTEITLDKLKPELVAAQSRILHERTQVRIGKVCLISAPFFAIGGAGLVYLSEKHRQNANDANDYKRSTIVWDDPKYNAAEQQVADEFNKWEKKFYPGIGLLGLTAIGLGVGLILYF